MKNFVLVFLVYLSVASCNESLNDIDKNVVSATFLEQSESNLILKQKFSSALVKVLGQNEEVRSLIKEEALKQIDFDYDVLYCLIKDKQLKNGVTLEEYFEKYLLIRVQRCTSCNNKRKSNRLICEKKDISWLFFFYPNSMMPGSKGLSSTYEQAHVDLDFLTLASLKYKLTNRTNVLIIKQNRCLHYDIRKAGKNMKIQNPMSIYEKLNILSDAAKYDVACTSSGTKRKGDGSGMGNCTQCGICHSFSADSRCISLLKILFTNECIFDCKYCVNRRSNDVVRTSFTPDEVCTLTMEFYRRNYIEGLFLSSGILISPDYTMELICATLYKLRKECNFQGYIHVKAIPGASQELIQKAGFLADRMSVNLELPTAEGLKLLAPHKSRKNILAPMRLIQEGRNENSRELSLYRQAPRFVPAGQSTQMIIGATLESDYQIMKVTESLYKKFELKRVFYSAFVHVNEDKALPARTDDGPPLLREHRLYQADWLLRYYHFQADELLSEEEPNFNVLFDPKCNWALKHLEYFPVEINRADYEMLLRVPGLGYKSATRIVKARRLGTLDFADLKKLGVVLKRAVYFITCNGKTMYPLRIEEESIARNLLDSREKLPQEVRNLGYRQLSLFDDVRFRENFYEKDLCV